MLESQLLQLESAPTDLLWEAQGDLFIASADGGLSVLKGVSAKSTSLKKKTEEAVPEVSGNNEAAITEENSPQPKAQVPTSGYTSAEEDTLFTEALEDAEKTKSGTLTETAATEGESDDEGENELVTTPVADKKKPSPQSQLADDDDSDDDIAFSQNPSAAAKKSLVLDEAEDDEDEFESPVASRQTQQASSQGDADNDSDMAGSGNDNGPDSDDEDSQMSEIYEAHAPGVASTLVNMPKPQAAFAPSSTPLELPHRYLCWNHLGSAAWHPSTHTKGTVEIQFTAGATRRPVSFADNLGFILGSIGEDGAIFATDLAQNEDDDEDDEIDNLGLRGMNATKAVLKKKKNGQATGSTLYFNRFDTIGLVRDKDWYITLPQGERALGCASGAGWAAVMTR